jgi:hypothetical protein
LFEDLLSSVEGIGDEWQVALRQEGLRPVFEFRLESSGGASVQAAADSCIRARLAQRYPALAAKTQQRMCEVVICLMPPGTLRRGRKLRRLVDERDAAGRAGENDALRTIA